MNLFQIASNDQSVVVLGQIFGMVGGVLQGQGSLLLGFMFKTINTTVLVLGALLVVHTTVVGLLKTAHEGEFLGKQWSSLWVPLRTVMGIAALFPTASGYSALQVVMMWVILQGVGAADTLWTTVLQYVSVMGSPYANVGINTMQVSASMKSLFQGLVCEASAEETDPIQYNGSNAYYYCGDPSKQSGGGCNYRGPSSVMDKNLGPGGNCGNFQYCDPNAACSGANAGGLACVACQAQVQALNTILTTLRGSQGIAGVFEKTDNAYLHFFLNTNPQPSQPAPFMLAYCQAQNPPIPNNGCCVYDAPFVWGQTSAPLPSKCQPRAANLFPTMNGNNSGTTDYTNASTPAVQNIFFPFEIQTAFGSQYNFIPIAVNLYAQTISQAVMTWLQAQPVNLQGWQVDAQAAGWILAGSYYYKISQQNSSITSNSMPTFIVNQWDQGNSVMRNYRNNMTAANDLMNAIASSSNSGSALPSQFSAVTDGFNEAGNAIESSLMSTISGGGSNPLSSLQAFGESLVITAEVGYPIWLTLTTVLIAVGAIDPMALGTGVTMSPEYAGLSQAFNLLTPVLFVFFAFCISFGSMLAVYCPFIPYIVFMMGAIGWITATIEAMVAMPFVAIGILSPGQSELLGRAEPSVMITLNVFLRPTLMVFGMMAGMLMASAVVGLINDGFKEVMASVENGQGTTGPVEIVMFIVVYTSLVITSLNKCFALIYMIPERTLTWIGGQPISYGEAEGLAGVKSGAEAGAAATGGAVGASAGQFEKAAGYGRKQVQDGAKAKLNSKT